MLQFCAGHPVTFDDQAAANRLGAQLEVRVLAFYQRPQNYVRACPVKAAVLAHLHSPRAPASRTLVAAAAAGMSVLSRSASSGLMRCVPGRGSMAMRAWPRFSSAACALSANDGISYSNCDGPCERTYARTRCS